jgi:hypothetical protein
MSKRTSTIRTTTIGNTEIWTSDPSPPMRDGMFGAVLTNAGDSTKKIFMKNG